MTTAAGKPVFDPEQQQDRGFMALALAEGARATFAFGCVITRGETVLASGRNQGAETADPTAHGEMVAIRRFLAEHGAAALRGTTLYTTGEPCPMCMGAILWCGIGRVVFAASIDRLATRMNQIMISSTDLAAAGFAPIAITGGVMEDEAMAQF